MDLTTEEGIQAYLCRKSFPSCHKVERLSEGFCGFVFRAHLRQENQPVSVIAKHVQPYAARAPSWKLDQNRMEFEHQALQLFSQPDFQHPTIRTPKVFHFDNAAYTLILEDAGDVASLKSWLQPGKSLPHVQSIGSSLGKYLANIHNLSAGNEALLQQFNGNTTAKYLSSAVYFGSLPQAAEKHGFTDDYVQEAAKQGQRDVQESSDVLTIGDFWTGNVLVSDQKESGELGMFLVDLELAKPGTAEFDVGQMAAEMYCLAMFRDRNLGIGLLASFLKSYRGSRRGEINAAKVAIRIGAHLFVIMPNAWKSEASEEQINEQLKVAANLIRLGVNEDQDGLRSSIVQALFT